jgi:hypothetical protein
MTLKVLQKSIKTNETKNQEKEDRYALSSWIILLQSAFSKPTSDLRWAQKLNNCVAASTVKKACGRGRMTKLLNHLFGDRRCTELIIQFLRSPEIGGSSEKGVWRRMIQENIKYPNCEAGIWSVDPDQLDDSLAFLDSTPWPNRLARTIVQNRTGHWLCAPYLKCIRMHRDAQISHTC